MAYKNKKKNTTLKKLNKITSDTKPKTRINSGLKIKSLFKSVYGIISVVVVLIGLISYIFELPSKINIFFSTPQKLYEDQAFIKGVLLPDYYNSNQGVTIKIGDSKLNLSNVPEGIPFTLPFLELHGDIMVSFKIENHRIYVSTTIKYIENQEVVGIMNFNKWNLFKSNILTFYSTDNILEVIDKQGNVVLSLYFLDANTISLQGYFVGNKWVTIIAHNDLGFYPLSRMDDIFNMIHTIKPVHNIF